MAEMLRKVAAVACVPEVRRKRQKDHQSHQAEGSTLQTNCCSMGEVQERRLRHLTGTWKQGTTTLVGADVACIQRVPTLGEPLSLVSHSEPTPASPTLNICSGCRDSSGVWHKLGIGCFSLITYSLIRTVLRCCSLLSVPPYTATRLGTWELDCPSSISHSLLGVRRARNSIVLPS